MLEIILSIIPWLIPVAAIAILLAAGYVKAPPDTAYIISGFRKPSDTSPSFSPSNSFTNL